MIPFDEAQRRIIESCGPVGTETVSLDEACGRVLTEDLCATSDLVPFARSAMDGFAIRSADVHAKVVLPISGRVYAERSQGSSAHEPHTATQIATGAPIPLGADAVVPLENVTPQNGAIRLNGPVARGDHIFPSGEDAHAGERLVPAGRRVSAADEGLLAAAGYVQVKVFRKPRAVVLTTGDEIVEPSQTPSHGQIRNSNAAVIVSTLNEWGCTVVARTHVRDDEASLRAAIASHIGECDLLVTTGGASVGERDLVKSLLGGPFEFDSVALRPAKPTAFLKIGRTRVLVLPGNPSSAFVALHELVRLAALTMIGRSDVFPPRVIASLAGRLHGKAERTYAAYARLAVTDNGFVATPLNNQCSALTRTASEADGFVVVPPGAKDYGAADRVAFDVADWSRIAVRTAP